MRKILFFIFAVSWQFSLADNEQVACMKKFDAQLKTLGAGMTSYANSISYKDLMVRVNECVTAGTCIKSDVVVGLSEIMVDEEVINIQRKKLSKMKIYFQANRQNFLQNNFCAVESGFSGLIDDIKNLNNTQLERLEFLIKHNVEPLLNVDNY